MTNAQIASILDKIADILEFQGANGFQVRAYRNGSRTVKDHTETFQSIVKREEPLTDIPGIGKGLAEKIKTLVETGELPFYQELVAEVSADVLAMMNISGLGPKKAAKLHKELNINSLDELQAACEAQEVRVLKGFGAKTEEAILKGIDLARTAQGRTLWSKADLIAQKLLTFLQECEQVQQIELAGSYRRGRETVGDLDILVTSEEPESIMNRFAEFDEIDDTLVRGPTKMSVRLWQGIQVDLRVVPEESFGAALQYFTGSQKHNVMVRGLAKDKGLKVNEYGVFRDDEYVAGADEQEVYVALDLPWFPPELREGRQEFDWAEADDLPELISLADLKGDLHMHTTDSDGQNSIEEMVAAAKKRKLKYIAITDHSKRTTIANGLDEKRLLKQWEEIDRINASLKGFTLLKGVECDILEKGGLDIDDEVLNQADWIVASVHFGQKQPQEQITKRITDALENPAVCVIGHPTGRLINERDSYAVDLDRVFEVAAEQGKFMELNASSMRLDLDDVACAIAKRHGIKIVISTDAHSIDGLQAMRYGVQQARRAGLTKEDVINTRTWKQIQKLMTWK